MKKTLVFLLVLVMAVAVFTGCAGRKALTDGDYTVEVALSGGTGKASVASPAALCVKDGAMSVTIQWSSDKYDFMVVGEETILPDTTEGGSVFTIPVASLDEDLNVQADTTAMSVPHLIDYTLTFDRSTVKEVK